MAISVADFRECNFCASTLRDSPAVCQEVGMIQVAMSDATHRMQAAAAAFT